MRVEIFGSIKSNFIVGICDFKFLVELVTNSKKVTCNPKVENSHYFLLQFFFSLLFLQAEEEIDKVVKEAINKPWLPLPLGLKPPSTDSVLSELSRKGISCIPSHLNGSDSFGHGTVSHHE